MGILLFCSHYFPCKSLSFVFFIHLVPTSITPPPPKLCLVLDFSSEIFSLDYFSMWPVLLHYWQVILCDTSFFHNSLDLWQYFMQVIQKPLYWLFVYALFFSLWYPFHYRNLMCSYFPIIYFTKSSWCLWVHPFHKMCIQHFLLYSVMSQ